MRKSSVTFFALLFVVVIYTSAIADSTTPEAPAADVDKFYTPLVNLRNTCKDKGWKTSDRYDFAKIDGFQETYNAEEQITFYLEGKSGKLDVEEANGFSVFVATYDLSRNVWKSADIEYDHDRRAWQVKLTAPKDITKGYKIVLNLFCKKNDSPCATTYGFGTQVDKILTLQIH